MKRFKKRFANSHPLESYGDPRRIARIFYWFIALIALGLVIGAIIVAKANTPGTSFVLIVIAIVFLPILASAYFVHREQFELAAVILALILMALITVIATNGLGIHHITIMVYPIILIIASLVMRKRVMVFLTIVTIGCAAWLVFGELSGAYTPASLVHSVPGDFFTVSLIVIVTASMVRFITESLFRANKRLQEELEERHQVEQALRFSEKKFSGAFHSSPVMMTLEDESHRFVDANQAFCDAIGYSREEVLGHTASDLNMWVTAEDAESVRKQAQEQNGLKNVEIRFRRKSGETGVVLTSSDQFEANETIYELSSGLDITERKRADDALRESESRFRGFVENTTDGIFLVDNQGKIIEWNPAMEHITGLERKHAIGVPAWELQMRFTPPEELGNVAVEEIKSRFLQIFESGILPKRYQVGTETKIQLKNGSQRVVEQKVFLITTTRGFALGILIHDITERKQMEDRLFDEKELAEVTLHSIGDAVITTDINAQIKFLNPIAENLTGWKTEEAVDRNLVEVFRVINEDSRKPVVDPVARCLQEGGVVGLANHSILISRDGHEHSIDDSAAPIRNRDGKIIGTVLVFHDITEKRQLSLQVAHDAMHDSLTGLINRREFEIRLERALASSKERNLSHVLCYLDLDQFKIVNDTAGHAAGDELLKQMSRLLSGLFRQRDTLARLGGDEFGLLLENCQLEQALIICDEVISKINKFSFVWEGHSFQIGASIGIVPVTEEKEDIGQLLSQADIACYSAKDLGRNRAYVYYAEDSETVQRHSAILQAARMKDAIINDQFLLYCQPIALLADGHPGFDSYEVLLRMISDEDDLVLPGVFIPPAERYGLMPTIDRWVIQQTFSAMSRFDIDKMQIAINLSGNSLDDDSLLEYVLQQLHEFSISPNQICFEITETAAIHHLSKAQKFIHEFRKRGGKIALDDFGSGFSSFRYLKSLSVDYIKIDGAFVSNMLANPGDQAIVEAITRVARTLGISVIAEHASDQETVNRLREIGVQGVQGFGIGIPVSVEIAWDRK